MTESLSAEHGRERSPLFLSLVVVLVLGVQATTTLLSQGLPVLYPLIRTELDLSRTQVGLITTFLMGTGIATALPGGWFADRFGTKRTIMIVLLSMTIVVFNLLAVSSFAVLLLVVGCFGLTQGPVFAATTKAVMDWLPGRVRGLAMGLKQTGVPAGGAVAAAVLPALALTFGWRMAAASIGVLLLVFAVIFLITYRDPTSAKKAPAKLSWATLRRTCRDRSLIMTSIWGFLFNGLQFTILSYLVLFAIETVGLSTIVAGGLLAVAQVSAIVARIFWGTASDFIFKRRRILVLAIIGMLTSGIFAAAGFINPGTSQSIMFLLAVMLGISTLAFHGVFNALVGELGTFSGQFGTTVGVANTCQKIGMSLVPPLFGYLADSTGSYVTGWRVAATMALVTTLALMVLAREPQHR